MIYFHTDVGSDFTISSQSVSFPPEAADGTQSCVTVTAICDDITEGTEVVVLYFQTHTLLYVHYNEFKPIHFIDGSG